MRAQALADANDLFRHVSAEKAELYRSILDVFARAKRQYRLQLRPDEVLAEARWTGAPPGSDDVNAALVQLRDWGNLESHPDTSRVSSLSDFYRARFLFRLSQGGEAVEAGRSFGARRVGALARRRQSGAPGPAGGPAGAQPALHAVYVSRWTWDGLAKSRAADPDRRFAPPRANS